MARPSKQFKKFAASGKLTDTIKKRRATKEKKKKFDEKVQQRIHQRGARRPEHEISDDEAGDDDDERASKGPGGGKAGGVAKTVDELFGAGGLEVPFEEGSDLEDLSEADEDEDDDDEDSEGPEDEDFDEEAMKKAMAALEKNDPEFFKHLKAEDPELLNFGKGKNRMDVDEDDSEDEDADEEMDEDVADDDVAPRKTVVTMKMLRGWREAMLKQHSLRSLRKMLLAFRAAAHMNEDEGAQGEGLETKYTIPSAEVFNKLVLTALKFTPVVLAHHLPYKTLPNGRSLSVVYWYQGPFEAVNNIDVIIVNIVDRFDLPLKLGFFVFWADLVIFLLSICINPFAYIFVIVSVKRHIKRGTAGSPKVANQLKTLVDKLEANRTFIEGKRRNVGFAPRDRAAVARFQEGIKVETTPLGTWVKVQRKVRAQRRKEIEKALREQESDDEE
ncbi:noc2p [Trichosporon asahii var. asahii CBS 8904]|uniref:Noc2p n=1 Tax=Trichosporon asahii var. asahii (strain CBS 8904) TaxID=1220162 RepID=K1VQV9_TRIAC|nr:noc2p [Trichosporon asahii var. asahii CBS 8904]